MGSVKGVKQHVIIVNSGSTSAMAKPQIRKYLVEQNVIDKKILRTCDQRIFGDN